MSERPSSIIYLNLKWIKKQHKTLKTSWCHLCPFFETSVSSSINLSVLPFISPFNAGLPCPQCGHSACLFVCHLCVLQSISFFPSHFTVIRLVSLSSTGSGSVWVTGTGGTFWGTGAEEGSRSPEDAPAPTPLGPHGDTGPSEEGAPLWGERGKEWIFEIRRKRVWGQMIRLTWYKFFCIVCDFYEHLSFVCVLCVYGFASCKLLTNFIWVFINWVLISRSSSSFYPAPCPHAQPWATPWIPPRREVKVCAIVAIHKINRTEIT